MHGVSECGYGAEVVEDARSSHTCSDLGYIYHIVASLFTAY